MFRRLLALTFALLLTLPGAMADGDYPRPRHDPDLDKRWMAAHGDIAPYTCWPVASAAGDIEHIVAFAEAQRSGLPESRAKEFVDDPLNIAVAYDPAERSAIWRVMAQCGPSDFSIQC